jgi:hypothetical protein
MIELRRGYTYRAIDMAYVEKPALRAEMVRAEALASLVSTQSDWIHRS